MVHRCCISACGMNVRVAEAKGHKGLTYHCFPLKEPNRGKWIQVILPYVDKPEGFKIVQGYTRVCSRHFRRKDYSLDSRKRARLNSNAVPSIFHAKSPSAPVSSESLLENTLPLRTSQDSSYINFSLDAEINFKNIEKNETSPLLGSAAISNDQLILPLTEVSTESPACKRLESDAVTNKSKSTHHKRRRSNRAPIHRSSKSHKTTSTPDELNIEGVGEALAEINLSTLMAAHPRRHEERYDDDEGKDLTNEMLPPDAKRITPSEDHGSSPKLSKSDVSDDLIDLLRCSISTGEQDTPTSKSEDQDLLQSIQAVNIHCKEPAVPPSTPATVEQHNLTTLNDDKEESQLSRQLDELLCGNSVLDDHSLLPFHSQDLLEAIRSTTEDFPSAEEIDQLACHLNSSFLDNEGLQPLLLDLDEIRISDLELPIPATFNSDNWIDFGNDMISQLSHISFEPAAKVPKQPEKQLEDLKEQREVIPDTPKRKITPPPPSTPVSSDSSPEIQPPHAPVTKKAASKKNSNCTGRFSAERFNGSDKDIEYYTGFSSYQSFESFYYSLEGHAEKLKVTDIMYGATSMLQASNDSQQDSSADEPGGSNSGTGSYVEDGRRLSQGRSMIRIDELFMTLIRLKRKLPEKVLGHMFCTSQSTVSRTVRAWTMLLSKVVETMPSKSTSPKCRKSNSSPNLCADENNCATSKTPGIPDSVLKLFNSDLARSIVSSGNSRKTSSSTCTSTSRSKRPKKEKMTALDNSTPLPSPDPTDVVSEDTTPEDTSVREIHISTDDDSLIHSSDEGTGRRCSVRESFSEDIVPNDFSITPIV